MIDEEFVVPSFRDISKIKIQQIDYDSIYITNADSLYLDSKSISLIYLGHKTANHFIISDSLLPVYSKYNDSHIPNFSFSVKVCPDTLFYYFTLRFVLFNSSFYDLDTFFVMCKYPYSSAETFLLWQDLNSIIGSPSVQDFAISDSLFFYHPFGADGLYQYDILTKENVQLMMYDSGDFFAFDSNYIFVDIAHSSIYKYQLLNSSYSEIINYHANVETRDYDIAGIAADQGILYVTTYNYILDKYDYKGNLLEKGSYPFQTSSLTKYENKLYGIIGQNIMVYDLDKQIALKSKAGPAKNITSIKIIDKNLYFSDYNRRYIGKVPLAEFLDDI